MKEMASTEAAGCTINPAQEAILEILVEEGEHDDIQIAGTLGCIAFDQDFHFGS